MEVAMAKVKKQHLENTIKTLINTFEEESGMCVDDINVHRTVTRQMGRRTRKSVLDSVDVTATIE